jgi:hypothetical protein
LALNNYQFSFNGFNFGGAGSVYQILDVDGLESLPELRVQDDNRGFNDGMFTGRDFYSGRTLVFMLNVFAGNGRNAQQNLALLQAALNPVQQLTSSNGLLQWQLAATDSMQRITARVRSRKIVIDPEYTFGFIRAQIIFFAPDPKYYDDTATTITLNPLTSAGGRTYSKTFNYSYGASIPNLFTVTNNGWATTNPTITVTGPVTNPTITNVSTGQYLTVNDTLTNLDSLVFDLENKNITLNGSSARNLLAVGSQWFGAPSGTTQFSFTGVSGSSGTTATIVYRNAYV